MPLQKKIDEPETGAEERPGSIFTSSFAGFAEAGFAAYRAAGDVAFRMIAAAVPRTDKPEVPRIGEYYADYSQLTPEDIAQPDPEAEALFKRSKPISR